jgi:hypothetical protein
MSSESTSRSLSTTLAITLYRVMTAVEVQYIVGLRLPTHLDRGLWLKGSC